MLNHLEKSKIIDLKRQGKSTREISRMLGINRETVSKYWNGAQLTLHQLEQKGEDARTIAHQLYLPPAYQNRHGAKRKATPEMLEKLEGIVKAEKRKNELLGWKKQKLTNIQIHQLLLEDGYDISLASVNNYLAQIRKPYKNPSVYIKQYYEYGKRLEYDFGEVKLDLGLGLKLYHMAVFCAPASNFRWCFIYDSQKQSVFLDSHVRFFETVGGIWESIVYDNMKNVVDRFEGRNQKKLNGELQKLASYYGFEIKTTNAYAGNEKGSVERSVEILRNRLFALNQKFADLATVRRYVDSQLKKINQGSDILIEMDSLKTAPPPYELAEFSEGIVSKYSFVSVEGNRYSVPEDYVGRRVSVKKYYDEIRVYFDFIEIARHSRSYEKGRDIVDITHFLKAFEKKPGALENSVALRAAPKLKEIFERDYKNDPRKFIELLYHNKGENADSLVKILKNNTKSKEEKTARSVVKADISVESKTAGILADYSKIIKGGDKNDN